MNKNKILILIFNSFILIFLSLFFILPKAENSTKEKRVLEKKPIFSLKSLLNGSYEKGIEKYFTDHFPDRNTFVGLNSYYKLLMGCNNLKGIYKGNDGYLINEPISFNKNNFNKNLNLINSFTNKAKLPTSIIIVPSTGFIMNEKLPAIHKTYIDEKILTEAKNNISSSITWIDLTHPFIQEKNNVELYYKTDHHWTTNGAYIAYKEYCKNLYLNTISKKDFSIKEYNDFYGTTYSKSALWGEKPDSLETWSYNINVSVEISDDNKKNNIKSDSMFFLNHLSDDDKYPIFLDGNHGLVKITNPKISSKKLLIIKDSYAHCLTPFLANDFNQIYMVDLRYYRNKPISQLIKDSGITDILILYGIDNIVNDTNMIWLK